MTILHQGIPESRCVRTLLTSRAWRISPLVFRLVDGSAFCRRVIGHIRVEKAVKEDVDRQRVALPRRPADEGSGPRLDQQRMTLGVCGAERGLEVDQLLCVGGSTRSPFGR